MYDKINFRDIRYTHDIDLFQTEVWSPETFDYKLPRLTTGPYIIVTSHVEVS